MVLSQYRAVKMSKEAAQRCLRKASDLEGEKIQNVLSRLAVEAASTSSAQVDNSLALVPYNNQQHEREQNDIYQRILEKNDSVGSTADEGLARKKVATPKRTASPKAKVKASSSCLLVEPEKTEASFKFCSWQ